jgi:hypothetical protein
MVQAGRKAADFNARAVPLIILDAKSRGKLADVAANAQRWCTAVVVDETWPSFYNQGE